MHFPVRTSLIVTYWCLPLLLASGAEPPQRRFEFQQVHMGTQFRIVLYGSDEESAGRASQISFQRIAELEQILSDYRADSELMQLCQQAGNGSVPVSPDLFAVLSRAEQISELSDGAFDVTVGPVVRLWRRGRRMRKLPDLDRIGEARGLVGYRKVCLDRKARSVQLLQAGMQLDLGGIAKGYAADEVMSQLRRLGFPRALVAAAGDIVVGDAPPETQGWSIAIAPGGTGEEQPDSFLLLHNAAVSSSGDIEQFVEIDGKRYSHIVDPRTGVGLTDRIAATVVAPDGVTCDPLATALCVMGPERGLKLVDSWDHVAARIVRWTDHGIEIHESERFCKIPRAE